MNPTYLATARLLIEVAPIVFDGGVLALKGGTAINMFLRELPRLSVDLDVVFPDHRPPRADALKTINEELRKIGSRLAERGLQVQTVSVAETAGDSLEASESRDTCAHEPSAAARLVGCP